MTKIEYEKKYIAFLDVLGFKELVFQDNKSKLETYFAVVQDAFKLAGINNDEVTKVSISDSIILMTNDSVKHLRMIVRAIRTIQTGLASIDIWMRGAITFGEIFFDDKSNIIVGPGFINSYLLEQEAIYPRVIIDPKILAKLKMNRREFYNEINHFEGPLSETDRLEFKLIHEYDNLFFERQTPNDAVFICYASQVLSQSFKQMLKNSNRSTMMDTVYNHIRKNLYNSQNHFSKYLWLKKYFHEVIIEYGVEIPVAKDLESEKVFSWKEKFQNL